LRLILIINRRTNRDDRQVMNVIHSYGKILDMSTGPGFVAIEVARLLKGTGCQIVGMDMSTAMLGLAAENGAKVGLYSELTRGEGGVKAMPFADWFSMASSTSKTSLPGGKPDNTQTAPGDW
jgi:ubiquinone/menaquinone biosynthesis C-methylase UbiE